LRIFLLTAQKQGAIFVVFKGKKIEAVDLCLTCVCPQANSCLPLAGALALAVFVAKKRIEDMNRRPDMISIHAVIIERWDSTEESRRFFV
jgi:hypothetical protein